MTFAVTLGQFSLCGPSVPGFFQPVKRDFDNFPFYFRSFSTSGTRWEKVFPYFSLCRETRRTRQIGQLVLFTLLVLTSEAPF